MAFKKIKNKRQKLIILFIICLFILPAAVSAENYKVIFNHLDGIGDDYGPGDYEYPQNHIFQNKGHLFDLKAMTIFEGENEYKIRFSFSNLTDPWGAEFGFSLPLIEMYIDHQSGGSNQIFHEGANVSFKENFNWNKFIKISGWWVRVFNPNSEKENLMNINELSLSDPDSNGNLSLSRKDNDLFLKIPKSEIDSLEKSRIVVMVGSFDPFGYDHFRSLSRTKSYWQVYSENEILDSKSPRLLDLLVPGGQSQKEVLSGQLPELPYLKVESELPVREPTLVDKLQPLNKISLSILFLYILFLIFVIYKFKYHK
ncbi:glucodextranase-like protein [Halanaerobium saccharolyticum]|uniref:Glucodextranase-like protein n=1 Tax=Halanaerobium saccharolyticum TaxID=43595 RepID=A0A4R7Z4D7_9FIRM|nr:glucodextranase DOMON-like domain-containing protein [Halanaerobium saccharolyticum]RAK08939.1 glucodextranase-like protein [Halanaerobium saccharolyticum]TDW02667.1 glucodextranase-like protein [Halanaerobium saccharolyticum]TDX60702.1 glucodextranase-like protein [Halanaerobium saccharolyticum]